jgi:inhibitor of KinA
MRTSINKWTIYSLGDHAIVFALAPAIDPHILQQITALHQYIEDKKIKGVLDLIPSYNSLTLVFDICTFLENINQANEDLTHFGEALIFSFEKEKKEVQQLTNEIIKVPVCYDPIFALDLSALSREKHLSKEAIIEIHCASIYQVYSIGFLPGFTYMGTVDPQIQMPRHPKPRNIVPAGSVGIAGPQTGIYPAESPGGWQIMGRTPWVVFDARPSRLSKFKVGNRIQFYPITKQEFDNMNEYN